MKVLSALGTYAFPAILIAVPAYAAMRGVKVYETFVRGAEEGFKLAIGTLPYLVAVFAAISCFRGSGALDLFASAVGRALRPLRIPADMVPLLLIRPISGSGALAITGDLLRRHGPDSPMGILASILQGATDTTFYVVTLYFGSVKERRTGHVLASCLIGDACGFLAGYLIWRMMIAR
ncbi:MAG TPA: spore maturation protein [Firmicutes bacterium]|nr:spore maturation protein [Candidatus Fermentithermobacillaceae bacterium]